ncbi:hypothetical protein GCM10018781_67090 [Kitasatospora indigofera]|uniref:Uncharacterized protein n=1 Tax=Kitasatospora indigofera TaxID=67307 RepID=A0A919GCR4_9ACTN|nr:hypothetical protein GCM10018781_67090 [Kitasatospora indigofera]
MPGAPPRRGARPGDLEAFRSLSRADRDGGVTTALSHEFPEAWQSLDDDLLDAFPGLDTPEGFEAELVEGEIVVTPPPDGDHETAIGRIVRQIARPGRGAAGAAGTLRARPADRPAALSRRRVRPGWRDTAAASWMLCQTANVSSLALIISSRRAGPQ